MGSELSPTTTAHAAELLDARARPDRRTIALLSGAHLCNDFFQGALPALLPFFILAHDLTYAAAAGLVMAANLLSSIVQPFFGWWTDRRSRPWIIAAGLACASCGVPLAALAPNYAATFALILLGGIGIAAFHPESMRIVHHASGERRGTGMSVFAFGGNLGFAIGPLVAAPLAAGFGLRSVVVLALPLLVMAGVLLTRTEQFAAIQRAPAAARATHATGGHDRWGAFGILGGVVFFRSVVFFGLNTFLPLYWIHALGRPETEGGLALSIFLGAGVAGTLLGGWAADRFGRKEVVVAGFALLLPVLPLFLHAQSTPAAFALLVPLGLSLYAPFSVMIVMGQEYLPNHLGTASGVTLGLTVTIGGLAAPALGAIADQHGVRAALMAVSVLPVLAVLLAVLLPRVEKG